MAYKVAYLSLMGVEKGPRLAPILVEMNQEDIIDLLKASIDALDK
jgi:lysyl-tRNA synthetase class I